MRHSTSLIGITVASFFFTATSHSFAPSSTNQDVWRRADATIPDPVPTITFNVIDSYFLKRCKSTHQTSEDKNPKPEKDKLEVYPRGIYDDFPSEGITIAFGDDLNMKLQEAMGDDCKLDREACRQRMTPLFHDTDIATHSKRFILVSAFLVGAIISVTIELLITGIALGTIWAVSEAIPSVKYEYSDLAQIHEIGNSDKYAVQHGPQDDNPTTITIPAPPKPPTPPGNDKVTMEILTADSGERKTGDIVYHFPQDSARRIEDLLGMLGIQHIVETCEGYNLFQSQNSRVRRADNANTVEECLRQLRDFVPNLMETIPPDAIELAQQYIPQNPAPGQAIGFPVQNTMLDGVHIVVTSYRIIRVRVRPGGPPVAEAPDPGFSMRAFLHSNLGYAILASAVMQAGQMVADIWVPKASTSTDIKEDEFVCPKDILCVDSECGAQKDDTEISGRNAFCKHPKHRGCKCARITYPHHLEVVTGYMDDQYKWMEELISLADDLMKPSLSIGMRTIVSPHAGGADIDNSWRFFSTKIGHAVGCDFANDLVGEITPEGPSDSKLPRNVDSDKLPWPAGEFKVKIAGQECYYKCDGTNPGRLWCQDREVACNEDSAKGKGSQKCDGFVSWTPAVYCDF